MIGLIHIKRHHDRRFTTWTSSIWTRKHEYEHECKMIWINACVEYLLEITYESCTWWLYGLDKDMVVRLFFVPDSRKDIHVL